MKKYYLQKRTRQGQDFERKCWYKKLNIDGELIWMIFDFKTKPLTATDNVYSS